MAEAIKYNITPKEVSIAETLKFENNETSQSTKQQRYLTYQNMSAAVVAIQMELGSFRILRSSSFLSNYDCFMVLK